MEVPENDYGKIEEPHHVQQQLCKTRLAYRQGRKMTAVKVYTIHCESAHLFVYGVPCINLRQELKSLCTRYGELHNVHIVETHYTEAFTQCYHVHYKRIQSARVSKRQLDNRAFYGGLLHVCYAPEYETIAETRQKLMLRKQDVLRRIGDVIADSHAFQSHFGYEKLNDCDFQLKRSPDSSHDANFDDPMFHPSKRVKQVDNVDSAGNTQNVNTSIFIGPSIKTFQAFQNQLQIVQENSSTSSLIPTVIKKIIKQEKKIVYKDKLNQSQC